MHRGGANFGVAFQPHCAFQICHKPDHVQLFSDHPSLIPISFIRKSDPVLRLNRLACKKYF
jgi:hypothetical protein